MVESVNNNNIRLKFKLNKKKRKWIYLKKQLDIVVIKLAIKWEYLQEDIISQSTKGMKSKYHLYILATLLIQSQKLLLMGSLSFGERSSKHNYKIGKLSTIQTQTMRNSKFSTVFGRWWEELIVKTAKSNIYIERE